MRNSGGSWRVDGEFGGVDAHAAAKLTQSLDMG